MRKADLQAGVEYAWREQQHEWGKDGPRRVRLLKILDGKRVLVADADGEFETTTTKLECPWLALGPDAEDRKFRTRADKWAQKARDEQARDPTGYEIRQLFRNSNFEPGKGGTPRVPETLPRLFSDLASGVLKLELGDVRREAEQIACYEMLRALGDTCERIRAEARTYRLVDMLNEEENQRRGGGRIWSTLVARRLAESELPFASSEIMPVSDGRMTRQAALTEYQTGSAVIGDFMLRVADAYDEIDRYGDLGVVWARTLYLRHQEAERPRTRSRT